MANALPLGGSRALRLKWHQLRRGGSDAPHDRANLRRGIEVGCWRLEPEDEGVLAVLERLIAAGADRLTTNSAARWAALGR